MTYWAAWVVAIMRIAGGSTRQAAEAAGVDYSHLRRGLEGTGNKPLPAGLRAGLSVEYIRRTGELAASIPALSQITPPPLRDMYSWTYVNVTAGAYTSIIVRYLADLLTPNDWKIVSNPNLSCNNCAIDPGVNEAEFGITLNLPRYAADAIQEIIGDPIVTADDGTINNCSELRGLMLPSRDNLEKYNIFSLVESQSRCIRRNIYDSTPAHYVSICEDNDYFRADSLAKHWILQAGRSLSRASPTSTHDVIQKKSIEETLKFAQKNSIEFRNIMKTIVYAQWIISGLVHTTAQNGFPHER